MHVNFDHELTYEEFEAAVKCIDDNEVTGVAFWMPRDKDEVFVDHIKMKYISFASRHALEWDINEDPDILYVRLPHRVAIAKYYENKFNKTNARNRMGCDENWYDCYYAITQTLHPNEVDNMKNAALDALVKVVCAVQEALY